MTESMLYSVIDGRDKAAAADELEATLEWDNWAEDLGMHADDRLTCFSCRDWADHAHYGLGGERVDDEVMAARVADHRML